MRQHTFHSVHAVQEVAQSRSTGKLDNSQIQGAHLPSSDMDRVEHTCSKIVCAASWKSQTEVTPSVARRFSRYIRNVTASKRRRYSASALRVLRSCTSCMHKQALGPSLLETKCHGYNVNEGFLAAGQMPLVGLSVGDGGHSRTEQAEDVSRLPAQKG